jgi:hypothetical protein
VLCPELQITFWAMLRGSLLPLLVWAGVACFVYFVYDPVVAMVIGGFFAVSFIVGFGLRRRAGHSVRCSVYGGRATPNVWNTSGCCTRLP